MKTYIHNNMRIDIADNGRFTINTSDASFVQKASKRANFELGTAWCKQLELENGVLEFICQTETEEGVDLLYFSPLMSLEIRVELKFIRGTNVIVQTNYAKNVGEKSIRINKFSSAVVENVAGDTKWSENDGLSVHICHNKWHGEGQWRECSLSDLGIYPTCDHSWARESYNIISTGSWSTANFYPLVMIEDKKKAKIWYFETEGSHNWNIKLTGYGGYKETMLTATLSGCEETNGGWYCDLKRNETYKTERAFLGVTKGSFEEAVKEINGFKRLDSERNNIPEVVFNDYMNCVWVNQEPESLIPLIDAAAEAGCEVFCIDDGWSINEGESKFGDWQVNTELYKDKSLKDIVDYINAKGMKAGIWLELDSCDEHCTGAKIEDALLRNNGDIVGNGGRCFYNMTNDRVCKYLGEKISILYDMGFRYIKNDYNQSTGVGCTNTYSGNSPAEGLIKNANGFYDFIDGIYREFPDLIIENCSSGGLRCDNKMLRKFSLQSISDQEQYKNNPSILMGTSAFIPAEKAGVWAYPYAVGLYEYKDFKPDDVFFEKNADGKETIFNTVTAMMGAMTYSGRIDLADKKNLELIKRGISVYKEIREYIPHSNPVYPRGMCSMNKKDVAMYGLDSEERLLLAIWNMMDIDWNMSINLSKYICEGAKVGNVYSLPTDSVTLQGTILDAAVCNNCAIFVEIIKCQNK